MLTLRSFPVPFVTLLSLLVLAGFRPVSPPERPNVVFLIADDWSYPHAGAYGMETVRTPAFDRVAREGALFQQAYCASPSCSPSRAAILTGRYPHQLDDAGNLWSILPDSFPNWVSALADAGYHCGSSRKGWGPGDFKAGGYSHQPAGKRYEDFASFLAERESGQPFSYWFGSNDPHRDYRMNSGLYAGFKLEDVDVPAFFPDLDCVRNDLLDYLFEVERFDRECGQIIRRLEAIGELDNTIIIMTSDNGMPFPRSKANLYDYGTHMPLAIRYPARIAAGTVVDDFVNLIDLSPSILTACGEPVSAAMSGRALWPLINGEESREAVFLERERHANVRKGDLSYPMRAIRTHDFLYIRNFEPNRWPAGDPNTHQSVGQFGDVDNSITKYLIMDREGQREPVDYYALSFGKRPAEELYDLRADPDQIHNVAGDPDYERYQQALRQQVDRWMTETSDRRATDPQTTYWDEALYVMDDQSDDVDLQASIDAYYMSPPGWVRDTIPCR